MTPTPPFSAQASRNQVHLRILQTTDLHAHVLPYDYYADCSAAGTGLAQLLPAIEAARSDAQNTLLVDNGDLLQGTPMGDYIVYQRGLEQGELHPIIEAMNIMGYDAGTLGNHEFNYGLEFLLAALSGAKFPMVCANVVKQMGASVLSDTPLIKPYVILERTLNDTADTPHPIKIGVIGLTPPQIMVWDRKNLHGRVETRDIVDTARAYIPAMKADGADIIIALSHSGIGSAQHTYGMENASVPLAALDGIDALATGHSHLVFPSPAFEGSDVIDAKRGHIHGKPATMAGAWGSHLGIIDLQLERRDGCWHVLDSQAEARPISPSNVPSENTPPAPVAPPDAVTQAMAPVHAQTLDYIRKPVGQTAQHLHSYFAQVANAPSLQLIADAKLQYMREHLKDTPHSDLPILCAISPNKCGGRGGPDYYTDVAAGQLTLKSIADLYQFPNTLHALRLTGAQLKEWLERSAGQFAQLTLGQKDQPLLNRSFPAYNFDVIAGVSYEVDLSQPSKFTVLGELEHPDSSRICNLKYEGQNVTDDMNFILATNNYRAAGGGRFPGADRNSVIFEGHVTTRDILIDYCATQSELSPQIQKNWAFTHLPNTTAVLETSPKAAAHMDAVSSLTIEHAEDLGLTEDGFAQFRLTL